MNDAVPFWVLEDEHTAIFYGRVPSEQTVLVQGMFEIAEGLGVVRTINLREGQLCILTTPVLVEQVHAFLLALGALPEGRGRVNWTPIAEPPDKERYLGHHRTAGSSGATVREPVARIGEE